MSRIIEFLKKPRGIFLFAVCFLTAVFSVLAIVLAVCVRGDDILFQIIKCSVYVVAAILLFYTAYVAVIYFPAIKEKTQTLVASNIALKKIAGNYGYKTTLFLLFSTAITLTVVVMNVFSAIKYKLYWYAAIATYYFTLLVFRGIILFFNDRMRKRKGVDARHKLINAWKIYLFVGAFLAVLEVSMAIVVTVMLTSDRPVESGKVLAISTAVYAFYKMSTAVYNIFKARRFKLPVVQAIRNLNFADACMSIFSLAVLLTATFGGKETTLTIIKTATGLSCLIAVIVTAAIMIFRAKINIKRLLEGRN